jgi:tRNA threonylcarbamoyladenosine biosynthesis protein TsaB
VRILAFDTATPATTVALSGVGEHVLQARDDPAPGQRPRHTTRLLPLIHELLLEAGVGFSALDRIAVGTGPGTFTGLRVGIATARALARAAGVGLVGVPTLLSLAVGARSSAAAQGSHRVLAVIDARRGEAFAAAWEDPEPGREPLIAPGVFGPDALARRVGELGGAGLLAVGDGAVRFRAVLERSGAFVPADGSSVHKVTAVIHTKLSCGLAPADPADVRPDYIRLPDAEMSDRATLVP